MTQLDHVHVCADLHADRGPGNLDDEEGRKAAKRNRIAGMNQQQMRSRSSSSGRGMHKESMDPLREAQAQEEHDAMLLQQAQQSGYTVQLDIV